MTTYQLREVDNHLEGRLALVTGARCVPSVDTVS